MNQDILLSVLGLRKSYNGFTAVDDISFSVYKGEVFSLLGPNGAGKTTTIKMLCGLLKADSGNITINGISLNTQYEKAKTMIGLCPQEIVVWELLTCLEQLKLTGMFYGMTATGAATKSEELLQTLGLWDKKNKLAKTLSGGMLRRLNIALALVHDPELIILDEPQAGLDPQSRILVRDYIRQLAKTKTILLTTHDMEEADRLSDRVAIMDHGKILLTDTAEKLKLRSGAGDVLQIRTKGLSQDEVEKILRRMPAEYTEKKYSDGCIYLSADELLEKISSISKTLKAFGITIEDMTIRKRTLEDAFIAMTGRGLRE